MAQKPSDVWRQRIADEATAVTSGELDPGEAFAAGFYPPALLEATDATLAGFEARVRALPDPSDEQVMQEVRRVVLDLNAVNDAQGGSAYETDERELLCHYLDAVLHEAGIDVTA